MTSTTVASQAVSRICIVHAGALGDTLLLCPLLRGMAEKFPQARRRVLTRSEFGRLLVHLQVAEDCADGDAAEATALFAAGPLECVPRRPAWLNCDVLISMVSSGNDVWAQNVRSICKHGRVLFVNPRPPPNWPGHAVDFLQAQLQPLELRAVAAVPRRNIKGPVLLHPGSGGRAKCWPAERFLTLARRLAAADIVVEIILGEVELERWPAEDIAAFTATFTVHRHASLCELADRLATARGYIGNDSGASHLAGEMGIPSLVLFGPSQANVWRPLGPQVQVAQAPSGDWTALTVADVQAQMRRVLAMD
ncbi:MAG: glycosyltransferase family 9 protein [Phycisphaerales bacterium]|nr:glycosyltransferase family 9 protein [Phycisphaerales bacterium]